MEVKAREGALRAFVADTTHDPPLIAPSDHTLLEQALSNLVDNAIRYNHAGGQDMNCQSD